MCASATQLLLHFASARKEPNQYGSLASPLHFIWKMSCDQNAIRVVFRVSNKYTSPFSTLIQPRKGRQCSEAKHQHNGQPNHAVAQRSLYRTYQSSESELLTLFCRQIPRGFYATTAQPRSNAPRKLLHSFCTLPAEGLCLLYFGFFGFPCFFLPVSSPGHECYCSAKPARNFVPFRRKSGGRLKERLVCRNTMPIEFRIWFEHVLSK